MKLLFDENLSPKLLGQLQDLFPGSENALLNGLAQQGDQAIWSHAKVDDFTIVTTDRDFSIILNRLGHPPKVVLLESWKYPTRAAAVLLRQYSIRIFEWEASSEGLLVLRQATKSP